MGEASTSLEVYFLFFQMILNLTWSRTKETRREDRTAEQTFLAQAGLVSQIVSRLISLLLTQKKYFSHWRDQRAHSSILIFFVIQNIFCFEDEGSNIFQ